MPSRLFDEGAFLFLAMRSPQLVPLICGLLAGAALVSAVRVWAMGHAIAAETYEDRYYLPPTSTLPALALGWDEAAADLIWARALVYVGEQFRERGAMAHAFDYADAMLALDPDFRAVYEWVASAGLYRPEAIDADDARRVATYLQRGVERFPSDGDLAWKLGAVLTFELPPLLSDPAEKDAARAEGTEYLMRAARLGAGPPWLALTNATILARVGRAQAAAAHLEEMYAIAPDDAARAELAAGISSLRSQAYAETMVELVRHEEERRAAELPYVPASLYVLVGPRPIVDWRSVYRRGFALDVLDEEAEVLRELTAEHDASTDEPR